MWRKKWEAKGFGFTLKRSNDFKLEDFHAAPCECFEPHYGNMFYIIKTKISPEKVDSIIVALGVMGIDGDGDVYNPDNIREFQRFVKSQTKEGVHFMMADGVSNSCISNHSAMFKTCLF